MADITELLEQATEIRDADTENENTALRVGTLLVNIIQTIGDYASDVDLQNAITQLWEQLPAVFAQIDSTGLLRWHQSPIVFLKSMGHDLDDVDGGYYTPTFNVGDVWYSGAALHYKESAQRTLDYSIRTNCIYVNKHTLRLYEYKSSSFVELTNENRALKNNRVIDDMEVTDLNSMSVGEVAFLPATKKIAIKTAERSWITFSPDPNKIYCDKDAGTTMIWDADEETWQQVGGGGGEGSGGGSIVTITEDENHVYINVIDNTPVIMVSTQSIIMGGSTKTATFKVSGLRLKGKINIVVSGTGFQLSQSSINPTDGAVAETEITLTYNGSTTAQATITISSSGATPQTISAQYTEQEIPTIDASTDPLQFKVGIYGTKSKTLRIRGYNLEGDILLELVDTNSKFSIGNVDHLTPTSGSVDEQVSISFSPIYGDSGTYNATLRLTSQNATPVEIPLQGLVSNISTDEDTLSFSTEETLSETKTLSVQGINLDGDISISIDGTDADKFSVNPSTIPLANASTPQDVEITYESDTTGTHSARLVITSGNVTKNVTLGGTTAAAAVVNNDIITKNGIKYEVISVEESGVTTRTTNLRVLANSYRGDIVIPSHVMAKDSGVMTQFTVTEIGDNAFGYSNDSGQGNYSLTSLVLPETLQKIGINFLHIASGIEEIVIPRNVISIGANFCAYLNKSLRVIDMQCATNPNFATTTFNGCGGCSVLEVFVLPDNVTLLDNAFANCTALKQITLGKNLAYFRQLFQNNAVNVETIICRGTTTIPVANRTRAESSYGIPSSIKSNAQVYVPSGKTQDYIDAIDPNKGANIWSGFTKQFIEYNLNDD